MNWLDFLIVGVIAFGALNGMSRGLVRLMFSLVGVVAGVILAGQNYAGLAQVLTFVEQPQAASVVAYLVVFCGALFTASLVGEVLHSVLGLLVFGCFDQALGLGLGAVVAGLVVQAALIPLAKYPLGTMQQAITESALAPIILTSAPVLLALLPPEFEMVKMLFQGASG